jgi:hypothetical protein
MKIKTETIERFTGAELDCTLVGAEYVTAGGDAHEITISFGDVGQMKLAADVSPQEARILIAKLQNEIQRPQRPWRLTLEHA